MIYSLVPYVGSGHRQDPFRPRGHDQAFWRALDLRPDATRPEGYALLVTRERVRDRGVIDLGPSPDDRWSLRALASQLGVTLERGHLRDAAADLLIRHSRTDGTRWRPLWPSADGMYRIWLGGLLWAMPTLRGGTTFTETWTAGDSASLTADQPWTETTGTGWSIASNRASFLPNGSTGIARCDTALATDDHQATIDLVTFTFTDGALLFGIFCRKTNDTAITFYEYYGRRTSADSSNEHRLVKQVASTETILGTDATDVVGGVTFAVEADGSSITGSRAGSVSVGPITDTAIVDNVRVGMHAFSNRSNHALLVDNLSAEDLASPDPPVFRSIRIGGMA